MRYWACAVITVLGVSVGNARAQAPVVPAYELPPTHTDPFSAPFFQPAVAAEPTLGPPGITALADAVGSNSPRGVVMPEVTKACACDPGFGTWVSVELLIGRTRGPSVAPVITTGPPSAGIFAGAVGQPATLPLFGGKRVLDDWRTGLRVELGAWLDPERRTGVGMRLYSLFTANEHFRAVPNGAVVINVPQSVSAGGAVLQVPAFVSFPGVTTGRVSASAQTTFAGGDLNWRCALERNDWFRIEGLVGYRQLHLADELGVNFAVAPAATANGLIAPQLVGVDDVRTRNNFYGPQLGLYASTGGKRLSLEGHAATALGATVSELDFARSRRVGLGGAVSNPVALLGAIGVPVTQTNTAIAAVTNQIPVTQSSASNRLSYFGVVVEGGARVNWRATDHIRLTAGYSFLYWNNVRRAQEMFISGPALRTQAIDFTTHLFSLGLDVRF